MRWEYPWKSGVCWGNCLKYTKTIFSQMLNLFDSGFFFAQPGQDILMAGTLSNNKHHVKGYPSHPGHLNFISPPSKNDGTGRRSFPFGKDGLFSGSNLIFWGCIHPYMLQIRPAEKDPRASKLSRRLADNSIHPAVTLEMAQKKHFKQKNIWKNRP